MPTVRDPDGIPSNAELLALANWLGSKGFSTNAKREALSNAVAGRTRRQIMRRLRGWLHLAAFDGPKVVTRREAVILAQRLQDKFHLTDAQVRRIAQRATGKTRAQVRAAIRARLREL